MHVFFYRDETSYPGAVIAVQEQPLHPGSDQYAEVKL